MIAVSLCACRSEPPPAATPAQTPPASPQSAPAQPQPRAEGTAAPSLQQSPGGGYAGTLPPLPMAPYVTDPVLVRAVYEFAARQPEVLRYVPCFCGCERNGHKGNEDCFVAARAADGRPQWDFHGMG
jgi:hypothetical protein